MRLANWYRFKFRNVIIDKPLTTLLYYDGCEASQLSLKSSLLESFFIFNMKSSFDGRKKISFEKKLFSSRRVQNKSYHKKIRFAPFCFVGWFACFFVFQLRVLLHQIGIKLFPSHITPKCQFVRVFVDFIKQRDYVKC